MKKIIISNSGWLGLDVNDTMGTTYAIHGNNDRIRMDNIDIKWIFNRIKENTNVVIVDSYHPFETISYK